MSILAQTTKMSVRQYIAWLGRLIFTKKVPACITCKFYEELTDDMVKSMNLRNNIQCNRVKDLIGRTDINPVTGEVTIDTQGYYSCLKMRDESTIQYADFKSIDCCGVYGKYYDYRKTKLDKLEDLVK